MKVLHVINSLDVGGAESNLLKLVKGLADQGVANEVMAIRRHGELEAPFRAVATALHPARTIDENNYDLVCGWLYQGCVVASLLAPARKVIWNVRHNLDPNVRESIVTIGCLNLMASVLSARAVVANSGAALTNHRERGLQSEDWVLIENGVDIERFSPGPEEVRAGEETRGESTVRRMLGIERDALVLLQVARVHRHKGQDDLIRAFAEIATVFEDVHLVLIGEGTERLRGTRIHGLGLMRDLPPYYRASDLLVNPSLTESFPTVVLEAMSCGVPAVVTRAGASADLVGKSGFVCDFGVLALVETIRAALSHGREALHARGQAARSRVIDRFSDRRAIDAYHQFLLQSAEPG